MSHWCGSWESSDGKGKQRYDCHCWILEWESDIWFGGTCYVGPEHVWELVTPCFKFFNSLQKVIAKWVSRVLVCIWRLVWAERWVPVFVASYLLFAAAQTNMVPMPGQSGESPCPLFLCVCRREEQPWGSSTSTYFILNPHQPLSPPSNPTAPS